MASEIIVCHSPLPDFGVVWEKIMKKSNGEYKAVQLATSQARKYIRENNLVKVFSNRFGVVYDTPDQNFKKSKRKSIHITSETRKSDGDRRGGMFLTRAEKDAIISKAVPFDYGKGDNVTGRLLMEQIKMNVGDVIYVLLALFKVSTVRGAVSRYKDNIYETTSFVEDGKLYIYKTYKHQ